jgi:hypothetical protein
MDHITLTIATATPDQLAREGPGPVRQFFARDGTGAAA